MRPEGVLGLMKGARFRYTSVRASLRYYSYYGGAPDGEDRTGERVEWLCRLWYIDRLRYRRELDLPDGGTDVEACGEGDLPPFRDRDPFRAPEPWRNRTGSTSPEEDPTWLWVARDLYWTSYLFDPEEITSIPTWIANEDLDVQTGLRQAGRDAIRLTCTPAERGNEVPDPLDDDADEYVMLVDAERGVLLRFENRLGGETIDALEVEEVYFDEEFGTEVFSSRRVLPWPQVNGGAH